MVFQTMTLLQADCIRILFIPSYYENDFSLALKRLKSDSNPIEYRIFTIKEEFTTNDLNSLLIVCRTIVQDERIDLLITDNSLSQLILGKLAEEFARFSMLSMNFVNTFQIAHRSLMNNIFHDGRCVPTLQIKFSQNSSEAFELIENFLSQSKSAGFIKSVYGFDQVVSSFRFTDSTKYFQEIESIRQLHTDQYLKSLEALFKIYLPSEKFISISQTNFLVQPFFDLTAAPYWRLVLANACINEKEILMWPLVDGYCGWPFLAEKPLAILPIVVCPSRQLSAEQQKSVYTRFRADLTEMIEMKMIRSSCWMQLTYFVSLENDIRLVSMKPMCSPYLIDAFRCTNEHGDPISVLGQLSKRIRPTQATLNGKTVFIHRLWLKTTDENFRSNQLIDYDEIKRHRHIRIRFKNNDLIQSQLNSSFVELGFIQVAADYYQKGLTNLIELRESLLKRPELVPFAHRSMLNFDENQFDPVTCRPSAFLIERLERFRRENNKDLP